MKSFIKLVIDGLYVEFAEYSSSEVDKMINDSGIIETIKKYPETYKHLTIGQIADRMISKLENKSF